MILISRNEEKLKSLQEELIIYGVSVKYYAVDIIATEKLKEIFSKIKKDKTIIDVVVNNAGIMEDAFYRWLSLSL